jgi:short-subunit dehydrogenase
MSTDRLVLITGASSGIGLALASACLQRGWRVALLARRTRPIEAALAAWPQARWRAWSVDVCDAAAMQAVAQSCGETLGLPDVVVANAGISLGVDLSDPQDLPVFAQVMDTNVQGLVNTFQPFIAPFCARGRGQLVGIASVAGVRGLPGHAAYCASKAAVIACCESLRGELRPQGVQVSTLAPGYVATPLTSRNRYPMPFLMSADDFARQALRAIEAGVSYCVIPWPMGLVAKLLRALPDAVLDRLLRGQPRKHRHTER